MSQSLTLAETQIEIFQNCHLNWSSKQEENCCFEVYFAILSTGEHWIEFVSGGNVDSGREESEGPADEKQFFLFQILKFRTIDQIVKRQLKTFWLKTMNYSISVNIFRCWQDIKRGGQMLLKELHINSLEFWLNDKIIIFRT